MRVTLVDPEGTILREIADPTMKRDDIAASYALALNAPEQVNWSAINHAIIDRWSIAALRYIKERAWRLGAA